jgi:hypothetical protein
MSFSMLQKHYNKLLKADEYQDALEEAAEEGHEDDDAHDRAKNILEAVKRKNAYKENMDVEKATYARTDDFALATYLAQKLQGDTDFSPGSSGHGHRAWYAQQIAAKHGPGSKGSKASYYEGATAPPKPKTKKEKMVKAEPLQKISTSLANLMSAAAGWAISDDVVRAGGGSPRGEVTAQQASEWERALSGAERRAVERAMRSKMRRKSQDSDSSMAELKTFYDASDTYVKRSPVKNGVNVQKDRAASPPRVGEMWDAMKHRWVKPENVGHSVTETQGKKRIRGTGVGVHERSVAGHGKGKTRLVESGRRFKGTADAGTVRPHTTPKRRK